jgi:hypothetical protein
MRLNNLRRNRHQAGRRRRNYQTEIRWDLASTHRGDIIHRALVHRQLLGQQAQEHLVPAFVTRGIALALGDQPLVVGYIFAMDKPPHTVHHVEPLQDDRVQLGRFHATEGSMTVTDFRESDETRLLRQDVEDHATVLGAARPVGEIGVRSSIAKWLNPVSRTPETTYPTGNSIPGHGKDRWSHRWRHHLRERAQRRLAAATSRVQD